MEKTTKSLEFRDVLLTFLTVIIAVVMILGIQLLLQVRSDLAELKSSVPALRSQVVSQRVADPFRVLDEQCTQCHSERRFSRPHSNAELIGIIQHMEALPDFEISAKDKDIIHGSLEMLRCVRCHEDDVLKGVISMPTDRQREIVERMRRQPGSDISRFSAADILKAMRQIQGY